MTDSTAKTINFVLDKAGLRSDQWRVVSCTANDQCRVRFVDDYKVVEAEVGLSAFIKKVNDWLRLMPAAASNRGPRTDSKGRKHTFNSAKLFAPIANRKDWMFVDYDIFEGQDGLLHKTEKGWTRMDIGWRERVSDMPVRDHLVRVAKEVLSYKEYVGASKLLSTPDGVNKVYQLLSQKTWKDVGLDRITPQQFAKDHYAFAVKENPKGSFVISPHHEVTLVDNPQIKIPWHDPYLITVWSQFLKKQRGIKVSDLSDSPKIVKSISYKGLKLFHVTRTPEQTTFTFYNPLGEIVEEVSFDNPVKPTIEVSLPKDPHDTKCSITVYGRRVTVEAHFPPKMTTKERKAMLTALAERFQSFPKSLILPSIGGAGSEEKPLRVVLATPKKAVQLAYLAHDPSTSGGQYDALTNVLWVGIYKSGWGKYVVVSNVAPHESAHWIADLMVSEDNAGRLEEPAHSALRDYYVWKLKAHLTDNEIVKYARLVSERGALKQMPKRSAQDEERMKALEENIKPLWGKVRRHFYNRHAVEGTYGILSNFDVPDELYSTGVETQYGSMRLLSFLVDEKGEPRDEEREPLGILIGLQYLLHQYGDGKTTIAKGRINRKNLFSHLAFKEILGVDLSSREADASAMYAKLSPNNAMRNVRSRGSGVNVGINLGLKWFLGDSYPTGYFGIDLEYIPRKLGDSWDFGIFPFLRVSLVAIGGDMTDAYSLGLRLYHEGAVSHEVAVTLDSPFLGKGYEDAARLGFGGHYGLRFHPGGGVELGLSIGYENGAPFLGFEVLIP